MSWWYRWLGRLEAEAHRRGLSVSEPVEELLRGLKPPSARPGRQTRRAPFKLYFVKCVSPDGRVGRAVTPGLHGLSAKLEPSVLLEGGVSGGTGSH